MRVSCEEGGLGSCGRRSEELAGFSGRGSWVLMGEVVSTALCTSVLYKFHLQTSNFRERLCENISWNQQ